MGSDQIKWFRISEISLFRGVEMGLAARFWGLFGFQAEHALDLRHADNRTRTC
jgi:hypothetical protein